MKIMQKTHFLDGRVADVEVDVADDYLELPPSPEPPLDDITALQLALAELAEIVIGGAT
jgi:hypothetical protein